jgi:hypothetical protein
MYPRSFINKAYIVIRQILQMFRGLYRQHHSTIQIKKTFNKILYESYKILSDLTIRSYKNPTVGFCKINQALRFSYEILQDLVRFS